MHEIIQQNNNNKKTENEIENAKFNTQSDRKIALELIYAGKFDEKAKKKKNSPGNKIK